MLVFWFRLLHKFLDTFDHLEIQNPHLESVNKYSISLESSRKGKNSQNASMR